MNLVSYKSPQLKTPCEEVPSLRQYIHTFDTSPPMTQTELVEMMVRAMQDHGGIGLSANQLGLRYKVFVMNGNPPIACFNPRVVDVSQELVTLEESCLSFPHFICKVTRPKHIKVRYMDFDGEVHTEKFTGMTARTFLHEMDHMNGESFVNSVSDLQVKRAIEKCNKKHGTYYIFRDFKK